MLKHTVVINADSFGLETDAVFETAWPVAKQAVLDWYAQLNQADDKTQARIDALAQRTTEQAAPRE